MFEPCHTCGGSGTNGFDRNGSHAEGRYVEYICPDCVRGRVVSESVIEEMAEALYWLDGGRPEIWDSIGDEMRRVYREKVGRLARVVLEHMEDNERKTG